MVSLCHTFKKSGMIDDLIGFIMAYALWGDEWLCMACIICIQWLGVAL